MLTWLGETTVSRISFLVYLVTMGNKKYCCRGAEDYSFVAYTHCPSYSFKHESRLFCEGLCTDVIKVFRQLTLKTKMKIILSIGDLISWKAFKRGLRSFLT